jgi:hypothetical protein
MKMEEFRWFNFTGINLAPIYALAYVFAAISYYLGCLLINLPHRGLKRAGWVLIYDGATYYIILALVLFIPSIVKFGYLLTGSYPELLFKSFDAFLGFAPDGSYLPSSPLVEIKKAYTGVGMILVALSTPPIVGRAIGTLMWSYIQPVLTLLAIAYTTLHMIYFLGLLIRSCWALFVAFGALIYGLPARIGRALGAALIAFSIVFAIGLPLLPNFVGSFVAINVQGPTLNANDLLSNAGQILLKAQQYNETYSKILTPNVLFICTPVKGDADSYLLRFSNGTAEWRIWTSSNGERNYALPPGRYNIISIEYLGRALPFDGTKSFTVAPNQATSISAILNIYGFSVKYEGVTSPAYIDLSQSRDVSIDSLSVEDKKVSITVRSSSNSSELYIFFTKDTVASWEVDSRQVNPTTAFSTPYGTMYYIRMLEGPHTVKLTILFTKPLNIDKQDYDPVEGQRGEKIDRLIKDADDTMLPFFNLSSNFFLTYFLLPLLYILVLSLLVAGFGRALGGRGLPIPGL